MLIDEIDRDILRIVQSNGRMTQRELGSAVGLSANAAGARLQRLVDKGVITRFVAQVDHSLLGRPMEASIDVWLTDDRDRAPLTELVKADDRIVECFHLTGPLDFRLRARIASAEDLNDLLSTMRNNSGVRQTDSRLILEQIPTTYRGRASTTNKSALGSGL